MTNFSLMRLFFRHREQFSNPTCASDDVLSRIKQDYFAGKSNASDEESKVREVEVTTMRKEPNLLPTSSKAMEEKPQVWYRKFSRNIHGLKGEKPYANLQWPPKRQE